MRRKLLIVLGVVTVVGVAAGLIIPAIAASRERPHNYWRCPSNLKQIGYGCHLYSSDFEGAFPPSLGHLYLEFISDGRVFLCRSADRASPIEHAPGFSLEGYTPEMLTDTHTDYVYVAGLADSDPEDLVVAYDREGNHPDGRNVLFVGSNVEWMTEAAFQAALGKTREHLAAKTVSGAIPSPQP